MRSCMIVKNAMLEYQYFRKKNQTNTNGRKIYKIPVKQSNISKTLRTTLPRMILKAMVHSVQHVSMGCFWEHSIQKRRISVNTYINIYNM